MSLRWSRPIRRLAEATLLTVATLQRARSERPAASTGATPADVLSAAASDCGSWASAPGQLTVTAADVPRIIQGLRDRGAQVRLRPALALTPRNRRIAEAWTRAGLVAGQGRRAWPVVAGGTSRLLLDIRHADAPPTQTLLTITDRVIPHSPHVTTPVGDIDAVITWVDDSDPHWRADLIAAGGNPVADQARWHDHGEGGLCRDSILTMLPWVRTIHVVTAGQVPTWLGSDPRVRLVDHREIFPDLADLPTFNSHAIEACLHRIPDLAEHFIYFNDDVVVLTPLGRDAFYDEQGRPIVALSHVIPVDRSGHTPWWAAAGAAAGLVDDEFGFARRRMLAHAPYPLTRTAMNAAEAAHPEVFARVRRARLRSVHDVAPLALTLQRALHAGDAVPGGPFTLDLQPGSPADAAAGIVLLRQLRPPIVCVNDGGRADDPVTPVLAEVQRILMNAAAG